MAYYPQQGQPIPLNGCYPSSEKDDTADYKKFDPKPRYNDI
jgi:hypothetical protein